ncbi:hypothetical protein, partial [Enterococcus faecium]|uniref:hypothetical protein n=1 Tax=Enterococcus faecium TaxID=1352 RepID=UPI0021E83D1D
MKAKIDLFYEKHPYLSLLINLLLGSIIGISVEYLLNKDFIGSGFYTVGMATVFLTNFIRCRTSFRMLFRLSL